ncbi:hypothetical protein FACS189435_2660 [Bacteroidia bacterium]|nr:hypothetical protein FACS189435_2660 [Bacteroidia bacterium]
MRGEFPPQSNDSYYFKVAFGESDSPSQARINAILALAGDLARAQGVEVKGSDVLKSILLQDNEQYSEQASQESVYRIETGGFKARFEIADLYFEGNLCWALFEVAYNPQRRTLFDRIEYTTDYKGRAFWRSLLVPGWGQMYKGSTGKGIAVLSLEVASLAGVFACNDLSNSYYNKAINEFDIRVREQYMDRSNSYRNIRNGLIIAASAVYVYNLVDAISAKGAKRYKATISPAGLSLVIHL